MVVSIHEKERAQDHHYIKRVKRMVQDTKKMGCPAQIIVKEITIDSPKWRRTTSEKVREHMSGQKDFTGECHFYIKLPEVKDHMYHITGEASGINQAVDTRVITKIHDLVNRGVTDVDEMRRHLRESVRIEIFPGRWDATSNKPTVFSHKERYLQSHVLCNGKEQIFKLRSNKCRGKSQGVANANPQWQIFLP